MNKVCVLIGLLVISSHHLKAQQFSLFNTNTLFDAFENPAQRAFVSEDSRPYASNFLWPSFGFNGGNRGDASYALKKKINDGNIDTRKIPIGTNLRNTLYGSSNVYLITLKLNPLYQNHQEWGFSWQVKSDAYADYTNESVVAVRNYGRFNSSQSDLFNGNGYGQSYHQFSVNYRVDFNEAIAFGFKLGVLSGITYNQADISQSSLTVNQNNLTVGLSGKYKASFLLTDELSSKTLVPDFKNPGLSLSFGTTYTSSSGVLIIGNVKDLGFIRWNDSATAVTLNNDQVSLNKGNAVNAKSLQSKIVDLLVRKNQQHSFYSPTYAKVDFLISRRYSFYTPNLIVSKNLFYKGGDVALVNNFKLEDFTFSLSPAYNINQFLLFGAQAMYQSPNFEFFLGTDNLLKSASIFNESSYAAKGVIGASLYMGIGIKFGYTSEHP